jgi:hypothetical protein
VFFKSQKATVTRQKRRIPAPQPTFDTPGMKP